MSHADEIEIIRKSAAAMRTMKAAGYVWDGGEYWRPPAREATRGGGTVAAMVVLETNQKCLLERCADNRSVFIRDELRRQIVDHMTRVVRVMAIMSEEHAGLMFDSFDLAARMARYSALRAFVGDLPP
jgi:hypothetical protein